MGRLLFFVFSLVFFASFAQNEVSFKNKQLINAQTTIIPDGFDFTIQHRFGQIALNESLYQDFLGFDLPANIRFSLSYKLGGRAYIGIGRTKINKTIDFEGKYVFLKQGEVKPLSIALYSSVGLRTSPFDISSNTFMIDSVTPFEYLFIHKLDYNTQLILSKSISNKLAVQFSPTIIYRNLVRFGENNFDFAIPFSGKYQYSFGSSVLFEYAYCVGRDNHPMSIGFEFGTAGHVFQVFATNSSSLRETNLYTSGVSDLKQKEFLLGFNIRRVWWF